MKLDDSVKSRYQENNDLVSKIRENGFFTEDQVIQTLLLALSQSQAQWDYEVGNGAGQLTWEDFVNVKNSVTWEDFVNGKNSTDRQG